MSKKDRPDSVNRALSNRMKSRGLQKLRWFCQMCQKQCRDENGFKCHTFSESHQRQLLLFGEKPGLFIGRFSIDFSSGYLNTLKTHFGTKRVSANKVYQEYINDPYHVHMNGTKWLTLTDFVKWLGEEGHCLVEETHKGWFIEYIDKSPAVILQRSANKKKEKQQLKEHLITEKKLNYQIETRKRPVVIDTVPVKEYRKDADVKVTFSIVQTRVKSNDEQVNLKKNAILFEDDPLEVFDSDKILKDKPQTIIDYLIHNEFIANRRRSEVWIIPGLVVKIVDKEAGEKLYKKKGVVKEIRQKFCAIVDVLNLNEDLSIQVDQSKLETVIPPIGKNVKIVNGEYRHEIAKILDINIDRLTIDIEMCSNLFKRKVLKKVLFEDVCKFVNLD